MAFRSGARIGPYEILGPLGAGGMGEIHEARDTRLGRTVAIKVVAAGLASRPELRERFAREARLLSSLNHPHICSLYDVGQHEGVDFLVLERLEGETLAQRLGRGPLPLDELLRIAVAVSDALAAAHRQRIVHRDLKPANVMISSEGWVKVLDFGLAVLAGPPPAGADTDSTVSLVSHTGALLGTIPYMSPEQINRRDLDARTDVFALGVVLYEAATGAKPFPGTSSPEIMAAILRDEPRSLRAVDPTLPAEFERIVRRCLAKDPAGRYASAGEVRGELAALRDGLRAAQPIRAASAPSSLLHAIAVLPLDDLSGEAAQTWFADGMTEAMITGLARIRGLRVIARNSVMRYRGTAKSPREVARDLGVGAIVTGSVLRVGERIRINAQLVDGSSEQLLWAESYERDLRDVLALQGDVAQSVARQVQVTLTPQDRARFEQRAIDPRAWEAYLRGRYHWNRRTEEELRRGVECFRDAIEADPGWALAHVGLADSYAVLGFWSFMAPGEAFPRAKAAALKALALDPGSAEARVSLAYTRHYYDWDWVAAEQEYRLAIEANPQYPTAHHFFFNLLLSLGRYDEALAEGRQALELDPLSLIINTAVAWIHIHQQETGAALDRLQTVLDLDRNFPVAWLFRGWALLAAGEGREAIDNLRSAARLMDSAALAECYLAHALAVTGEQAAARGALDGLLARAERRYISPYFIALIHTGLGDEDGAFAWLDRALAERTHWLTFLKVDSRWAPLHADPRFGELVARVGLPAK